MGRAAVRRRSEDEGFTLVEMLVAIFILSVGMLALLSAFIGSAKSLQNQKVRSDATRVAVDRNESFRAMAYENVPVGVQPQTVVTRNNRTFRVDTTITTVNAADLGTATTAPTVKQVRTVVGWTLQGSAKTVAYETAISPESSVTPVSPASPTAAPTSTASPVPTASGTASPAPTSTAGMRSITGVNLSPQPYSVNASGAGTQNLLVTAVLVGYAPGDLVIMRWTNDGGASAQAALTSVDGSNWSASVTGSDVVHATAAGVAGSMNFVLDAGFGLTRTTTLATQRQVADPPTISSRNVQPASIVLVSGKGTNAGQNSAAVTLSAVVTGLDTTLATDSVKVSYLGGAGGTSQEIALQRDAGNKNLWSYTFRAKSEFFAAGTSQPFTFTVTRKSDGGNSSSTAFVSVGY